MSAPNQIRPERFALPDGDIEALLAQNAQQVFALDDPAWLKAAEAGISKKRLGVRGWARRIVAEGRNARSQADVRASYEEFWTGAPTEQHVQRQWVRSIAIRWRDRGAMASPQLLRQVHVAFFTRAIEVLRPRSVLEVGCGNGNTLFTLAACFPEVAFTGVELTKAGVDAARALQREPVLPRSIADAAPKPVADPTAHVRAEIHEADARRLPLPARGFDLVYTRLALEQMEAIRKEALAEITRVASNAVVLLEPWRDHNETGPGRDYIRRQGYFAARVHDLASYGFDVIYSTADLPQKVQFSAGPAIAVRRSGS